MPERLHNDLRPLNARNLAEIAGERCRAWGWNEKRRSILMGKLTRGSAEIAPLDSAKASAIIADFEAGRGMSHALKRSGVTQRRYWAWIAKSHSGDPDAGPYVEFRLQLGKAFERKQYDLNRLGDLGLA